MRGEKKDVGYLQAAGIILEAVETVLRRDFVQGEIRSARTRYDYTKTITSNRN